MLAQTSTKTALSILSGIAAGSAFAVDTADAQQIQARCSTKGEIVSAGITADTATLVANAGTISEVIKAVGAPMDVIEIPSTNGTERVYRWRGDTVIGAGSCMNHKRDELLVFVDAVGVVTDTSFKNLFTRATHKNFIHVSEMP
jgi:hypothetical protein